MSYFHLGADSDGARPSDPATQATPEAPEGSSPSGEYPSRKEDLLTAAWFIDTDGAALDGAECERIATLLRDLAREQ